jgi:hypothetical protein
VGVEEGPARVEGLCRAETTPGTPLTLPSYPSPTHTTNLIHSSPFLSRRTSPPPNLRPSPMLSLPLPSLGTRALYLAD